jgi:cell fate regulator YaaT (PSP1 superfamily)
MSERQTVVAVKLRYNPKIFWFDAALSSYEAGDHVLVDTERGREIGLVIDPALEVTARQVKELKSPLKPVIRTLTAIDFDHIDELDERGRLAMPVFRDLIEKHGLGMKPVSVEFLFSGGKAIFYFSSDERVDFRELVRELASWFHVRVDMRQIGVRDEARIFGGLAHCGEELCCARLGGEFQPVSIRMAKEQDLPLNPSKISGACGRLMCCLRYEFEAYRDFKNRAPKKGALIKTPMGQAKVVDFDTPREIITMRLEDGKLLSIPLSEFDCTADENGKKRPCGVSRDAIDRCASSSILMALAALEQELTQGDVSLERERASERPTRRPRRSGRQSAREDTGEEWDVSQTGEKRESVGKKTSDRSSGSSRKKGAQKGKPRPGQHSSGLRGDGRDDGRSDGVGSSGEGRRGVRRDEQATDYDTGRNASRGNRGGRGGGRNTSRAAGRSGARPADQAPERSQRPGGGESEGQAGDGRRLRRRRSGNKPSS